MSDNSKKTPEADSSINTGRRSFMKAAVASALGVGATIGPWPLTYARGTETRLNWLAYPGHATEEVIGPFQKEYGVEIQAQEFTAGERMLALINSSPRGTFDLVMDDTPYIEILARTGMLEALDAGDFPLDEFYPEFVQWPGLSHNNTLYSIPTTWGYNGLAYNSDVFTEEDVQSYSVMWDERLRGRLGMRDWYLPVMGVFSANLGFPRPYDISNTELNQVVQSMFSVAPHVRGFYGFSGVFNSLADGSTHIIPGCGD